jgi:hypothetical protein
MLQFSRYFSFPITLLVIASCGSGDCDENSAAVDEARALSQARLAQMYFDMERLHDSGETYNRVPKNSDSAPPAFADIQYHNIILSNLRARLLLEGCFDHYVILYFEGIVDDREPMIRLQWGELTGSKVLWRSNRS